MLYAARDIPDGLPLGLPDLRSRLAQCARIVLQPLDHSIRDNDDQAPAVPEGEAVIQACVDYSAWQLTRPDGSVEPLSGPVRSTFEYHVRLDPVGDRWQVYEAAATGRDC